MMQNILKNEAPRTYVRGILTSAGRQVFLVGAKSAEARLGRTKKDKVAALLAFIIFSLIGVVMWSNYRQQLAVDHSKIPEKVEQNKGFQKWITNLKNKDFIIEADEFQLKEENEIYNTKWLKVYSFDDDVVQKQFEEIITAHRDIRQVVFSPSNRAFVDYRHELRDGLTENVARYYGLRDDKVLDAKILDCSLKANCYFDRAFFLDNDTFVISEISRTIDKKLVNPSPCLVSEACEYSFKLHLIDLKNNKRLVYESKPFNLVLEKTIPEF